MQKIRHETLVIVTPGFPKDETDSTCIPPQQVFVKALKQVNTQLNIVVLTLTYPHSSSTYQWHGIKVISFGTENKGRVCRLLSMIKMWHCMGKLHKEYQIVGLLSFWLGKCAYIAGKFAKKHQLRHYSWLLGQDAKAGNKYFGKIKPAEDSLIAISDFIANGLKTNYGVMPRHIIPVGIDTTLFKQTNGQRDIDILGAGSLIPLKQYAVFLEVVKCLKYLSQDVKAVICGDGPEMELLKSLVSTMQLEDNITLTGELPHADVLALMQRAKVLLHPSNYEGFSTVCLEALYAGAQVVSFVQPMDTEIPNWHVAANKEDMLDRLAGILQNEEMDYLPVLPYRVHDNAREITRLFGYSDSAIASNCLAIASNESLALK